MITENASALVLTLDDFEPGWIKMDERSTVTGYEGAQSTYFVYYAEGSPMPSVVQNTVAVYPTIGLAHEEYIKQKPTNVSLDKPNIGDESFTDVSIIWIENLVFRQSNVLVKVWVYLGSAEPYAQILEKKCNEASKTQKAETQPVSPSTEKQTYTLDVNINPSGSGSVFPSSGEYAPGLTFTMTATPATGYAFDFWNGDASGSSPSVIITMDSDQNVIANFRIELPMPPAEPVPAPPPPLP